MFNHPLIINLIGSDKDKNLLINTNKAESIFVSCAPPDGGPSLAHLISQSTHLSSLDGCMGVMTSTKVRGCLLVHVEASPLDLTTDFPFFFFLNMTGSINPAN